MISDGPSRFCDRSQISWWLEVGIIVAIQRGCHSTLNRMDVGEIPAIFFLDHIGKLYTF